MSVSLETLAREKQELVERSAVTRMRLRRDARTIRDALDWKRAARNVAFTSGGARIATGLALSLAAGGRVRRLLLIASRVIAVVGMARVGLGFLRGRNRRVL